MALWRTVAEDTLDYCLRELKAADGGFFCGQDADSGGDEGAYYLFTPDEVKSVLGDEGGHFCECYDITPEGNFRGKSIPNLLLNTRWAFLPEGYDGFCERLRIYREERMTLGTDTKILTAWNGLMLMALSRAARAFSDRRYLMEAEELAGFMAASLHENGALMARLCEGELKYAAQLDDYAFYALGLMELYSADFDPAYILKAEELAENIRERFADGDGGYFRTAIDAEKLIVRPKEIFDGAMPSGNSAAAVLFDRLFRLTGKEPWARCCRGSAELYLPQRGAVSSGLLLCAHGHAYGWRIARACLRDAGGDAAGDAKGSDLALCAGAHGVGKDARQSCRSRSCRALHRGYAAQGRQACLLCLHRRQLRSAGGYGIKMDCRDFNFRGSPFIFGVRSPDIK